MSTPVFDRPLRIGVLLPDAPPTDGGSFQYEQILFAEILSRIVSQSLSSPIHYIPVVTRLSDCDGWSLDLSQVFLLEPELSNRYRSRFKRLLKACLAWLPGRQSGSLFAAIAKTHDDLSSSIDLLWSLGPRSLPCKTPFILTVWDLQHRLQPFFPELSDGGQWPWHVRQFYYSNTVTRSFLCLVGTQRGGCELRQFFGVDSSRILVNPLPCPPVLEHVESTVDSILRDLDLVDRPYLLYPAQFWSHKNHLGCLLILRRLLSLGHSFKLVFTGSDQGTLSAVQSAIRSFGLDRHVLIAGFVTRSQLASLYRHCFAVLFASLFGPDNLPPLEAMSYCAPAVVAEVPGAREQYGDAVLYFNPADPSDGADKIISLAGSQSLRDSLVQKGLQLISNLTPEAYVDAVERRLLSEQLSIRCASMGRGLAC